jgi:hypothetical protein
MSSPYNPAHPTPYLTDPAQQCFRAMNAHKHAWRAPVLLLLTFPWPAHSGTCDKLQAETGFAHCVQASSQYALAWQVGNIICTRVMQCAALYDERSSCFCYTCMRPMFARLLTHRPKLTVVMKQSNLAANPALPPPWWAAYPSAKSSCSDLPSSVLSRA